MSPFQNDLGIERVIYAGVGLKVFPYIPYIPPGGGCAA